MASFMKKNIRFNNLSSGCCCDEMSKTKDWKVIRFGTESSYAPFEYIKHRNGKLTGFDVDLGSAICVQLRS